MSLLRFSVLSLVVPPALLLSVSAQETATAETVETPAAAAEQEASDAVSSEAATEEDSTTEEAAAQTPATPGTIPADLGYNFTVPEGWEVTDSKPMAELVLLSPLEAGDKPDTFRENLNVVALRELPEGTTAESALAETLPAMQQMLTGFSEVDREAIEVGGQPAQRLHYRATLGEYSVDNDLVIVVKGNLGLVITCTTLEGDSRKRFEKPLRDLVSSLTFTE